MRPIPGCADRAVPRMRDAVADTGPRQQYKPHERTPVTTAAHTIYVEGEGAVLLKHMVDGKTIKMRLEHVLHVPQITTRLLSMGQFLLQGMRVSGDALSISLLHKSTNIITCKPLYNGSTIFILEATPVQLNQSALVIYKADYELMHKRLGHPSKDVLTNAPNCVNVATHYFIKAVRTTVGLEWR